MQYRPLKDYVAKRGGVRLSVHPRLRDQLVDLAVEEYPCAADADVAGEVLAARLSLRARRHYGSVMTFLVVHAAAVLVAGLVWQWHGRRHAHRVLMLGWQEQAKRGR